MLRGKWIKINWKLRVGIILIKGKIWRTAINSERIIISWRII